MKRFPLGLTMMACLSSMAVADPAPSRPGETYATCKVWETTVSYTKTKVPQLASAYCETGNEGGGVRKSCTVDVGPQGTGLVLDKDVAQFTCNRITGDRPCDFVAPGPLVFVSDRLARRTFSTDSERVGLTQYVGQIQLEPNYDQHVVQNSFQVRAGRRFTVMRLRSATAVTLDCRTSANEQILAPISAPGQDINDRIKFVKIQPAEPYDFFVFEATKP